MNGPATLAAARPAAVRQATRVAVVAALGATAMLFASLMSAYVVRRSFADWRPFPSRWPFLLLALGLLASAGIEVAARSGAGRRRFGLITLGGASAAYLVAASAAIASTVLSGVGLSAPHPAFVALLLGVHLVHAVAATGFAGWLLRDAKGLPSPDQLFLARLVTHFLTALLVAILFLLFVLR